MSYSGWRPYVPVAERRCKAAKKLAKLGKNGRAVSPVTIAGRSIAKSLWGKSWCTNLERYSDYENRLPRGRTYVRNGSVVDLQIVTGKVSAVVSGSDLYTVTISIAPITATRWKAICRDCAGTIDSLVELLQGRLSKGVMDRVCREADGLFPAPKEIKLSCSCPDWADMCKHVAAVLYGIGVRLDEKPALLFELRGVDETELLANAGQELSLKKAAPTTTKVLDDRDVAALFGLEMAEAVRSGTPTSPEDPQQRKTLREPKTHAGKRLVAYKKGNQKRANQQKKSAATTAPVGARPTPSHPGVLSPKDLEKPIPAAIGAQVARNRTPQLLLSQGVRITRTRRSISDKGLYRDQIRLNERRNAASVPSQDQPDSSRGG